MSAAQGKEVTLEKLSRLPEEKLFALGEKATKVSFENFVLDVKAVEMPEDAGEHAELVAEYTKFVFDNLPAKMKGATTEKKPSAKKPAAKKTSTKSEEKAEAKAKQPVSRAKVKKEEEEDPNKKSAQKNMRGQRKGPLPRVDGSVYGHTDVNPFTEGSLKAIMFENGINGFAQSDLEDLLEKHGFARNGVKVAMGHWSVKEVDGKFIANGQREGRLGNFNDNKVALIPMEEKKATVFYLCQLQDDGKWKKLKTVAKSEFTKLFPSLVQDTVAKKPAAEKKSAAEKKAAAEKKPVSKDAGTKDTGTKRRSASRAAKK